LVAYESWNRWNAKVFEAQGPFIKTSRLGIYRGVWGILGCLKVCTVFWVPLDGLWRPLGKLIVVRHGFKGFLKGAASFCIFFVEHESALYQILGVSPPRPGKHVGHSFHIMN
jgi:hypothetical protein